MILEKSLKKCNPVIFRFYNVRELFYIYMCIYIYIYHSVCDLVIVSFFFFSTFIDSRLYEINPFRPKPIFGGKKKSFGIIAYMF